ncbi:unnamed protein product [Scytosiphon promiscuus]
MKQWWGTGTDARLKYALTARASLVNAECWRRQGGEDVAATRTEVRYFLQKKTRQRGVFYATLFRLVGPLPSSRLFTVQHVSPVGSIIESSQDPKTARAGLYQ